VVLVLDARGMTRGVAPLILGYRAFDADINIAGVILNQLGGSRHEAKLRAVIEHYTDVPVIGAVARDSDMEILERHLGLIPSNEQQDAAQQIVRIGRSIEAQVDLDMLLAIAADSSVPPAPAEPPGAIAPLDQPLRIAVARDEAFGFYYPGDLEAMTAAGAELIAVDTLRDTTLPAVDGLFIGGGFPESCMQKLQANVSLRGAIRQAIEDGLPVYAECGGLMYLSRSLSWKGSRCEMVGSIPADTVMHERPQGRGYVRLAPTAYHPWGISTGEAVEICAHEFHYSALDGLEAGDGFAFQVMRGTGIDGAHDGFVYKNLLACYTHQRTTRGNRWTEDFLRFVSACKSRRRPPDNTPSTQRG
jgi:cobyrinic acid a,c-diamide synthase